MENLTPHNIPKPNVSAVYDYGWSILKENFWKLLAVMLILIIAGSSFNIVMNKHDSLSFGGGGLLFFFWLLVGGPIAYSGHYVFLKAVRREQYEIGAVFSCFGPNYVEIMLAHFLVSIITLFGFIFLIIPGIVFSCKLAFVPYLVIDKGMSATDAIKKSWEMTTGYSWKIFLIGFISLFLLLFGLLVFFVGAFVAIVWIYAAFASMYYAVDNKRPTIIEV